MFKENNIQLQSLDEFQVAEIVMRDVKGRLYADEK